VFLAVAPTVLTQTAWFTYNAAFLLPSPKRRYICTYCNDDAKANPAYDSAISLRFRGVGCHSLKGGGSISDNALRSCLSETKCYVITIINRSLKANRQSTSRTFHKNFAAFITLAFHLLMSVRRS
jgi:hypothetical protein